MARDGERLRTLLEPLIAAGDVGALARALDEFDVHPSDIADLLEGLPDLEARLTLLRVLSSDLGSEALAEMEEGDDRGELLAALSPAEGADLLGELADDDAADLISELEPDEAARILAELPAEDALELRDASMPDARPR